MNRKPKTITTEWLEPTDERTTSPFDFKFRFLADCVVFEIQVCPRVRVTTIITGGVEYEVDPLEGCKSLDGVKGAYLIVRVAQRCDSVRIHVRYPPGGRRVLRSQKKLGKKRKKGKRR